MDLTTIEYIMLYCTIALSTVLFYKILTGISKIVMLALARTGKESNGYQNNLLFARKKADRRSGERRHQGDRRSKPRFLYCRNVFACEINDRRVCDRRKN